MKKLLLSFCMLVGVMSLTSYAQDEPIMAEMIKDNIEPYYFSVMMNGSYDEVEMKVKEALKKEGFGVITYIEIDQKLNEKLGVEMDKYVILGACSPKHAYQALQAENKIGTMLPCNVIIRETGKDEYEVAAVNPIASMMAIQNEDLVTVAMEVTENLKKVIASLED